MVVEYENQLFDELSTATLGCNRSKSYLYTNHHKLICVGGDWRESRDDSNCATIYDCDIYRPVDQKHDALYLPICSDSACKMQGIDNYQTCGKSVPVWCNFILF